jgi:hypothetical protein
LELPSAAAYLGSIISQIHKRLVFNETKIDYMKHLATELKFDILVHPKYNKNDVILTKVPHITLSKKVLIHLNIKNIPFPIQDKKDQIALNTPLTTFQIAPATHFNPSHIFFKTKTNTFLTKVPTAFIPCQT